MDQGYTAKLGAGIEREVGLALAGSAWLSE